MTERTILDYNKKHYLNLTNLDDKDYIDLKLKIKNHYVVIIDNKNDIEWLEKDLKESIEFITVNNYEDLFKKIFS